MNEVSSRSHTILTIFLETKSDNDEKGCLVRISKLNFVDLAGSEKQKQTEVSGCELK
jgi:kinesin family protein 15